jgi:transcriptional regulator with XRE-family HTH domain
MVAPPDPRYPWQALAAQLAAGRVARGWTVRQLAARVERHPDTILLWEVGRHRPPRPLLRHVADVLGVPFAELARLAGYVVDADG